MFPLESSKGPQHHVLSDANTSEALASNFASSASGLKLGHLASLGVAQAPRVSTSSKPERSKYPPSDASVCIENQDDDTVLEEVVCQQFSYCMYLLNSSQKDKQLQGLLRVAENVEKTNRSQRSHEIVIKLLHALDFNALSTDVLTEAYWRIKYGFYPISSPWMVPRIEAILAYRARTHN